MKENQLKKRILLLVTFSYLRSDGGGVESWLQKFLNNSELLTVGYDTIIVIGLDDENGSFADVCENRSIIFKRIKVKRHLSIVIMPQFLKTVLNTVGENKRDKKIDVIFVGSSYPSYPILFLRKDKSVSTYIWLRSFFPLEINSTGMKKLRRIFLALEHVCLKKADMLIANGYDTEKLYAQKYPDIPKIVTIPNGVDRRYIKENKNALQNKCIHIAFVGRLEKIKGFDSYCKSIARINEIYEDNKNPFKFSIVGFGSLESSAILLSKTYKNVNLIGRLSNKDVCDFLATVDCTVNLTLFTEKLGGSGLSNSLLESIFARHIIVAWDNVIFRQILTEDSAILVKENDVESLANAYLTIAKEREVCITKIEKALEIAQNYDFEQHMKLFSDLMNSR